MTRCFIKAPSGPVIHPRVDADAAGLATALMVDLVAPAISLESDQTAVIDGGVIFQLGKVLEMLADGGRPALASLIEFWDCGEEEQKGAHA